MGAGADSFSAGDAVDFTGNLTGAAEDVVITAAELSISGSGLVTVNSLDTTGVGLTTLNADVSIDTTGLITLGDLIGAHLLTLTSVGADVELRDAAIQALIIDDADAVDFNGNFDTTGNVTLSGITELTTITADGSIHAGGNIRIDTIANITIDGTIEADGDIDLTTDDDTIDIDAAITGATVDVISRAVELSSDVAANAGNVNITGDITIDGTSLVAAENGNITFAGTVEGDNSLEANAPGGTVDFNSTVGAVTALGGLDVHADDLALGGSVTVAGGIDVDADTIELAVDAGDITTTVQSNTYAREC